MTPVIFAGLGEKSLAFMHRHQCPAWLPSAAGRRPSRLLSTSARNRRSQAACMSKFAVVAHFCNAAALHAAACQRTSRSRIAASLRLAVAVAGGDFALDVDHLVHGLDRLVGDLGQHVDVALVPAQAARRAGGGIMRALDGEQRDLPRRLIQLFGLRRRRGGCPPAPPPGDATAISRGMTTSMPLEIFIIRVSAALRFCPMIGISIAEPTRFSRISAILPRKLASAERNSMTSAASAGSPVSTACWRSVSSSSWPRSSAIWPAAISIFRPCRLFRMATRLLVQQLDRHGQVGLGLAGLGLLADPSGRGISCGSPRSP